MAAGVVTVDDIAKWNGSKWSALGSGETLHHAAKQHADR